MLCLTVCEPWAHAIMYLGKDVENRSRFTNHRGPLLIHAGKSTRFMEAEDPDEWPRRYGVRLPSWSELRFGAVLGVVDLVDCRRAQDLPGNPWAEGPWCWVLADPRPLAEPYLLRGMQGLYDVPLHAHPALAVPEVR